MHPFIKFRNTLLRKGLEAFGLYYAEYEGLVADNEDPEGRGRIKVYCPAVYGKDPFDKWCHPKGMFTGKATGFYAIPPLKSPVWVSFKGGDPEYPIWTYGWYPKEYAPKELTPTKFQFITPAGYNITFDEENGSVLVYFDENREVLMNKDETILKSGDNKVVLKEKISIQFGGVSMVDYLDALTGIISTGQMVGGAGPYVWSPDALVKFEENVLELKKMME